MGAKKFNELTISEFGEILYRAEEASGDDNSDTGKEWEKAVEDIFQEINEAAEKDRGAVNYTNTYLCNCIYLLYLIYRTKIIPSPGRTEDQTQVFVEVNDLMSKFSTAFEGGDATKHQTKWACEEWIERHENDVDWDHVGSIQIKDVFEKLPLEDDVYKSYLSNEGYYIEKEADEVKHKYDNRQYLFCIQNLKIITKIENEIAIPEDMAENTLKLNAVEIQIKDYIESGASQIILTGAPGTGKTRSAKRVAEAMGKTLGWAKKNKKYELVQFHPSYDYTDFVEGLRPVEKEGDITFKKMDGIFKGFCRNVVQDEKEPEDKYFFIIDEINRTDLSKVFGELMYGLEQDKRGEDNSFNTQYQNLTTCNEHGDPIEKDCFADGFYIPENVVIIGTMNDIDRSVESMDMALRRRFLWYDVEVTKDLLTDSLTEILTGEGINVTDDIVSILVTRIMNLNDFIKDDGEMYGLNKDYFISQGQFTGLPEKTYNYLKEEGNEGIDDFMKDVWDLKIEGLIKEYVRSEDSEDTFVNDCKNKLLDRAE